MPYEPDPDTDYDRMREDELRERAYIEAEREAMERAELGLCEPFAKWDGETEVDETDDVPF